MFSRFSCNCNCNLTVQSSDTASVSSLWANAIIPIHAHLLMQSTSPDVRDRHDIQQCWTRPLYSNMIMPSSEHLPTTNSQFVGCNCLRTFCVVNVDQVKQFNWLSWRLLQKLGTTSDFCNNSCHGDGINDVLYKCKSQSLLRVVLYFIKDVLCLWRNGVTRHKTLILWAGVDTSGKLWRSAARLQL